jgi:hypothetical protein
MSPVLYNDTDAGYRMTSPKHTKDRWKASFDYNDNLSPSGFIYLADFYDTHRGGALFYFKIHLGLYGIPYEYYQANPGGINIWDSEIEPGYGDAPTWLVRFDPEMGELAVDRTKLVVNNYWSTVSPIVVVQV